MLVGLKRMRFGQWFACWVDRSFLLMLLAMLILFISSISHWYYVPIQPSGNEQWFNAPMSLAELMGRIAMLLMSLAIPYYGLRRSGVSYIFQRLCWVLLLLVFFFPLSISQWEPEQLLAGNSVYLGLERISADMEANMNQQQSNWRYWQTFSSAEILAYQGAQVPMGGNWGFSLITFSEHPRVLQDIWGYSNDFLNVVSRGWVFAGAGLITLLIACSLKGRKQSTASRRGHLFFIATLCSIAIFMLMPRAMSEYYLQRAEFSEAQGRAGDAIAQYRAASDWLPSLKLSLDYYGGKFGALLERRGCSHCYEVLVMQFVQSMKTRDFPQARFFLEAIERRYPQRKVPLFWADSLNNQQAIEVFNRGQYSLAGEYWKMSQRLIPYNPIPYYGMAMVNAKLQRFGAARDSLETLTELQQYLTFKRLTIEGQYIVMQGWAAHWEGNERQAFELYRLGLTPEAW